MSGRALRYLTQPPYNSALSRSGAGGPHWSRRRGARRGRWEGRDMAIVAVALDRFTASFADGVFERRHALLLGSSCPGHVKDLFLQNRAVQIIHAVAERDLRQRQTKADPIRGEMVDAIEIDAAHGEIAQLFECGSTSYVREHCGLRFEGKRNKPGKSAGLIL